MVWCIQRGCAIEKKYEEEKMKESSEVERENVSLVDEDHFQVMPAGTR